MIVFTAPFSALKKLTRRYKSDHQGVAAIEFVFVAPVMIFMYFGLAEISSAIIADRQISHATNVAGDLATQVATIDAAQMSEIMTATTLVMGIPSNKIGDVKLEIASFSRNAGGDVVPLGKASLNAAIATPFDADGLDDLILSPASGVVVARVEYNYEPLKLRFFDSNITLSETFLLKPRVSANVVFENGTGTGPTDYICTSDGFKATCT